jgi:hypothetical protein
MVDWKGGQPPDLERTFVDVLFDSEEDAPSPDVLVPLGGQARVPAVR